ncbi:MAG: hypothetical protein RQ737_13120, partial [Bacteroidales bacterium]|nr:hypothetical protein [Bacteroidales bacterium]
LPTSSGQVRVRDWVSPCVGASNCGLRCYSLILLSLRQTERAMITNDQLKELTERRDALRRYL